MLRPIESPKGKYVRLKNWTDQPFSTEYYEDYEYLVKGDNRIGNKKVTLTLQSLEEVSLPEQVAYTIAERIAEWVLGGINARNNLAIDGSRDLYISKALPDIEQAIATAAPKEAVAPKEAQPDLTNITEPEGTPVAEAPVEVTEEKKKPGRPKKVEDDFAGLQEDK